MVVGRRRRLSGRPDAVKAVGALGWPAMPELAIVIPAYRSREDDRALPRAVQRRGPGAEIVVVDSAPGWDSAAVADGFPHVRVIRSDERLLPHAARNRGARESDAPLLLFTDPGYLSRDAGAVAALVGVSARARRRRYRGRHLLWALVRRPRRPHGEVRQVAAPARRHAHRRRAVVGHPHSARRLAAGGRDPGGRNAWRHDVLLGARCGAGCPLHLAGEAVLRARPRDNGRRTDARAICSRAGVRGAAAWPFARLRPAGSGTSRPRCRWSGLPA